MYCGAVEFVCSPSAVRHIPVLLHECMACLKPERGGAFADLTFGGGGHSREILAASSQNSLLAMDCDPDARERSVAVSSEYGDRFSFFDSSFTSIDEAVSPGELDGVLMDLGISSFQLMEPEKGFSFRLDAPIDMRLDPRRGQSAAEFSSLLPTKVWFVRLGSMGRKGAGGVWLMQLLKQGDQEYWLGR